MRPRTRILIVDDNAQVANLLRELFAELGYPCTVCTDAAQAVAVARQCRPMLAFIDIGMPQVDGFQVARNLRASGLPDPLYLVALTAWTDGITQRHAIQAGFDLHARKPSNMAALLELAAAIEAGETPSPALRARLEPPAIMDRPAYAG
jgi:CheY-like chemotaxis protein